MYKKLVIAMKTLGWSGVSNTPKILWYLANHGIQNRVFYMLTKHLSGKIPWFCLKTLKILCSQTPPKWCIVAAGKLIHGVSWIAPSLRVFLDGRLYQN
jgi:hypothetical protein